MRSFCAFAFVLLLLAGCIKESPKQIEPPVVIETSTIIEEEPTATVESPKLPLIAIEEEVVEEIIPTLPLHVLTSSTEYHLNYIADFTLLALSSIDEQVKNGVSSVIHDDTLPVTLELYNPKSDYLSKVKVEVKGHDFKVSLVNPSENEVKVAYLAAEIDFQGCNSERFVLYYKTNNQAKVYLNDSLVLTVDSMERIKSESSLQSLPFELKSGKTLLFIKCLVDANGLTGQLMLMPENASKQYLLEVK